MFVTLGKAKLYTWLKSERRVESARGEEQELNLQMDLEKQNKTQKPFAINSKDVICKEQ